MSSARRVLVTGASGGIGRAVARALASAGFDLGLHCHRNVAAIDTLRRELGESGIKTHTLQFDVTDRANVRRALEEDVERDGPYWGVVCNAGVTADNAFPAMPAEDWDRVVDTNLGAFYNVLHPLVMPLIRMRDGGRIVSIASVAGQIGNRGQVNYSAAKAGLMGATKALAVELASRRITVNCVAPGMVETDMLDGAPVEEMLKFIPLRRAGKPEEVAALVAFLFSEGAAYITKQVIGVNGGLY